MASDVHMMSQGGIARSSMLSGGSDHSQLSGNPALTLTRCSDSPTLEVTRCSDSPTPEVTRCPDNPTPEVTRCSDSPTLEVTRCSDSPTLEVTRCSDSPTPEVTRCPDNPTPEVTRCPDNPTPEVTRCPDNPTPEVTRCPDNPTPEVTRCPDNPTPEVTRCPDNPTPEVTRCPDNPTPEVTRCPDNPTPEVTRCPDNPTPEVTRCPDNPTPEVTRCPDNPTPEVTRCPDNPTPEVTRCPDNPTPEVTRCPDNPTPEVTRCPDNPTPEVTQRSDSPAQELTQCSESLNPELTQRSDSPAQELTQRSDSPAQELTQRSDSPAQELTQRSDSPAQELTQRSDSPAQELTQRSDSPAQELTQRSDSPAQELTQRSDSPAQELTQRSDSPGTTLTQGTEPGASQDEAMFVHARSYEDLTGEEDVTVPRSPGVEENMESSSMEQISQDFSKLSTQLSVSSLQDEDQTKEGASEPGTRDASRSVSGEEEVFRAVDDWYRHQKHVFVLSEAGKPVYSRYRSEEVLSSTAGVMIALVSFLEAEENAIRSIHADGYKVVFVRRSPLVLVSVSHTLQSEQEIAQELIYVYYQIVSLLTGTQLHHLFQQRPSYDLRRLLAGSERITDSLLDLMDVDPSFLLGAVRCLPLAAGLRDSVSSSLQQAKAKSLVFSILMSKNQLVSLARKDDQLLHYVDLHLLFNLVTSSSSFREGEAWTPVCFPKFNSTGFFHAHISYLSQDPELCLMLISTDREDFFTASDCKRKIVERLEKRGYWGPLTEGLKSPFYDVAHVGISEIQHFLYKSKSSGLFTSPVMGPPYHTDEDKKRLLSLYQYLHSKAHCSTHPLPTIYHMGPLENMLAWVTDAFELYASFGPMCTKMSAVTSAHRLLHWMGKEEDRMFILVSHTY